MSPPPILCQHRSGALAFEQPRWPTSHRVRNAGHGGGHGPRVDRCALRGVDTLSGQELRASASRFVDETRHLHKETGCGVVVLYYAGDSCSPFTGLLGRRGVVWGHRTRVGLAADLRAVKRQNLCGSAHRSSSKRCVVVQGGRVLSVLRAAGCLCDRRPQRRYSAAQAGDPCIVLAVHSSVAWLGDQAEGRLVLGACVELRMAAAGRLVSLAGHRVVVRLDRE